MKLTDEQRQIVTDNHNLIFWYLHKMNLALDEWYSLLAIELCHAVMKHDPEKGLLSTYFKLRCDWVVAKELRKAKALKRTTEKITFIENIHSIEDPHNVHKYVELQELLKGPHGKLLNMKYEGYSQTEMAKELGVSQTTVSKMLKQLRDDWHEVNGQ